MVNGGVGNQVMFQHCFSPLNKQQSSFVLIEKSDDVFFFSVEIYGDLYEIKNIIL
jgi:hypothetical protein